MLGHKKELAILLALGCGWTLGGMSTEGGTAPSVSLFNRCEANAQIKPGTIETDSIGTASQSAKVVNRGSVSIIDSTGSTNYNINYVHGKTTVETADSTSKNTVAMDARSNTINDEISIEPTGHGISTNNIDTITDETVASPVTGIKKDVAGAHEINIDTDSLKNDIVERNEGITNANPVIEDNNDIIGNIAHLYGTNNISAVSFYGNNHSVTETAQNINDTFKTVETNDNYSENNGVNNEIPHADVIPWWEDTPTLNTSSPALLDSSNNITTRQILRTSNILRGNSPIPLLGAPGPNVRIETGASSSSALHEVENVDAGTNVLGEGYTQLTEGGTSTAANEVYGKKDTNDVSGASVKVDIGTKTFTASSITGGYSSAGDAENNSVFVESGTINSHIYGGQSESGEAQKNYVIVTPTSSSNATTINGNVIGAESKEGAVSNNSVAISVADFDMNVATYNVFGGYIRTPSNNNDVSNNTITLGKSSDRGQITLTTSAAYGGAIEGGNGNVINNSINILGAISVSIGRSIYGGYASGNGSAVHNIINIAGNSSIYCTGGMSRIVGGWSHTNSSYNSIVISGRNINVSTQGYGILGGYSDDVASNNTVRISKGYVSARRIAGAYALSAENNKVDIYTNNNDDTITINGDVYGGYSNGGPYGKSNYNTVTIGTKANSGQTIINKSVTGGYSSADYDAIGNHVNIFSGSVMGNVVGGECWNADASSNSVNVFGGTVTGNIYGGRGTNPTGKAINNIVTLAGGTIQALDGIYGGYSNGANATYNTINLYGTADIAATSLYGGNQAADITGNTLNLGDAASKIAWTGGAQSVKNVANFDNFHFNVIPWWEDTPTLQKPAMTITDGANSDLSNTKIDAANVYFTNVSRLAIGAKMTLLDDSVVNAINRVQAENLTTDSLFTAGTTLTGKGVLSLDAGSNVIYTITQSSAQEQTHKTVMGMEASMATLAVGNDFIGRTLDGLADVENEGKDGLSVFAAYGGGTSKYETGSYIRANTWNAILGLGKMNRFGNKDDKERGFFQWGAFFEYGSGNYSTHDCDVRGDGSAQYTGGGLLAKWKNDNGVYAEGSVRAGSVTDKASNMLHDVLGGSYGYDTRSNYLGAHVGLGKIYRFGDDHELDLYGKYFYTQRDGISFDAGGRYNLDKVTSNVLRVGMRYGMTGKKWNWFSGLAYEYEFDGKATGTADGAEIRAADISGGSLRAEVGVEMKPSEDSPWSMRMSAEGYCGERQGFGGTLSLTYAF